MLKKTAKIRSSIGHRCPFGLDVGPACRNAGKCVDQMEPLGLVEITKKDHQAEQNLMVLAAHGDGTPCKYADKIVDGKDVVHCDYGEGGAGHQEITFLPNSQYPRLFSNVGMAGYYSYPLKSYSDNNPNFGNFIPAVFASEE